MIAEMKHALIAVTCKILDNKLLVPLPSPCLSKPDEKM